MKLTREQRHANLELQMDWEEANERGEPFEVEAKLPDESAWTVIREANFLSRILIYRRKQEPPDPFRAFCGVLKLAQQYKYAVSVQFEAKRECLVCDDDEKFALLPADELAKLEREHGEMLAVLKAVDEYRHRNIAELETRWDALCDSIEKAIKQCDS